MCGEPSLACSLIPIRLPTGTAFYVICVRRVLSFPWQNNKLPLKTCRAWTSHPLALLLPYRFTAIQYHHNYFWANRKEVFNLQSPCTVYYTAVLPNLQFGRLSDCKTGRKGFEPLSSRFGVWYSTIWTTDPCAVYMGCMPTFKSRIPANTHIIFYFRRM